jgi:hypothetical protein
MQWYVAELVVECRVGRQRASLWDQQIVVFRARDAEQAHALALAYGKRHDHEYANSKNEVVRWRFKGLSDLIEVSAKRIKTGTEIYSRLLRKTRPRLTRKRDLTVFWAERNTRRTAAELLNETVRPYAPR